MELIGACADGRIFSVPYTLTGEEFSQEFELAARQAAMAAGLQRLGRSRQALAWLV